MVKSDAHHLVGAMAQVDGNQRWHLRLEPARVLETPTQRCLCLGCNSGAGCFLGDLRGHADDQAASGLYLGNELSKGALAARGQYQLGPALSAMRAAASPMPDVASVMTIICWSRGFRTGFIGWAPRSVRSPGLTFEALLVPVVGQNVRRSETEFNSDGTCPASAVISRKPAARKVATLPALCVRLLLGEGCFQVACSQRLRCLGVGDDGGHAKEFVGNSLVVLVCNGHARGLQLVSQHAALRHQRID